MIKCKYCKVINNKDFGTCSFCGAPLVDDNYIDEDDLEDFDIEHKPIDYDKALSKVTLSQWKQKMKEKGITSIAAYIDAISKMPDDTIEEQIERMTRFTKTMSFKHNRKE